MSRPGTGRRRPRRRRSPRATAAGGRAGTTRRESRGTRCRARHCGARAARGDAHRRRTSGSASGRTKFGISHAPVVAHLLATAFDHPEVEIDELVERNGSPAGERVALGVGGQRVRRRRHLLGRHAEPVGERLQRGEVEAVDAAPRSRTASSGPRLRARRGRCCAATASSTDRCLRRAGSRSPT